MSRPSIVLIHGFRGSPLGLKTIAEYLRQAKYEVYIPAIPPFAGAEPLADYTPRSYANFIKNYIKTQNLDRPILVGHSMGSIIAAATAHYYPDLIDRQLILLSPISTKPARFFASLTPLSALLPRRVVDYITTRYLFIPQDHQLFQTALTITHDCSNDHPPQKSDLMKSAHFSANYCIADFDLSRQAILMLAGDHDRLIPQKTTIRVAQHASAQAKFLPNTGHLHNYEDPAATAQSILEFLTPKSPQA